MNEQFSVFDEWGNKVGEFIPTGGGLGDTVIMIFVLILAWVFGFVIYLFIKLIIKGFEAISDERWDEAVAYWRSLITDKGASFDKEIVIDCNNIVPQVSWGTSPMHEIGIDQRIPDPDRKSVV